MKRNLVITSLLAASAALAQPAAQQPSDFKGVVRKNRAPVSNEVLRVKFTRPAESKLGNGLTLLVIEDHRSPTVSLQVAMQASSLSDPADLAGLSGVTSEMLRLGTTTRNSRQIAETLAELGASIFSGAGERYTTAQMSTLSENLDPALELFADVLLHPSFPADELEKLKNRSISNYQQARSQPGFLAIERFQAALYPGDNRSLVLPTPEAMRKITRDLMVEYYKANYRPEGGIVAVVGDVNAKQLAGRLDKLFGEWKGAPPKAPVLAMSGSIGQAKVYLIHRPNSVQTNLWVGNLALDRKSPDYIASQVMNRVLGSGPASRLFRNIREEKGYTYGIGSFFAATQFNHHFAASTSVRTEVTGPALEELLKEFRDIQDRPVPADELEGAKRAMVAEFALSTESQNTALSQALTVRQYGFPADYWDTYPEKITQITAADVQRVGKKYVPVANAQIVAVGDATKIREVLAKFGPVEEWDAEGHKVK